MLAGSHRERRIKRVNGINKDAMTERGGRIYVYTQEGTTKGEKREKKRRKKKARVVSRLPTMERECEREREGERECIIYYALSGTSPLKC